MMKVNEATDEEYEERESITPPNKVGTIIGVTLVAGIALVISGITPLGITAIASNSMMPAFDKGSAVITIKVKETELKEGDIISFNKGNKKIIHRINSIEETDGEKRYYTKGDANRTVDDSYITYKDIDNKIILSIPLIGYPSIMISELLSK
jgi:signal peptidase